MVRVKALVASKPSHGRDTLLRQIVEIEHECELDEVQSLYDDRPLPLRPVATKTASGDEAEHETASHVAHATA